MSNYYPPAFLKARKKLNAGPGMHAHHIDEDSSNNDVSNLIVLTPKQHRQVHSLNNRWLGRNKGMAEQIGLRIPEDLLEKIRQMADKDQRSLSNMIVVLLDRALKQLGGKKCAD